MEPNPNPNVNPSGAQQPVQQPAVPQQPAPQAAPQQGAPQYGQVPPAAAPQQPAAAGQQTGQTPPNIDVNELKNQAVNFSQQMQSRTVKVSGYTFSYVIIVTIVGAVLSVVASALPFATISVPFFGSQSGNLFHGGDGWFFLGFAVAVVVLAFLKKNLAALIVAAVSFVLAIYELVRTNGQLSASAVQEVSQYGGKATLDYGAWILLIAGIAMLAGTIIAFINERAAAKQNGTAAPAAPAFAAAPAAQNSNGAPAQSAAPQAFPAQPQAPAPSAPFAAAQPAAPAASTAPAASASAPAQPVAPQGTDPNAFPNGAAQ